MAIQPFNVMEGFDIGQKMAGQSGLTSFLSEIIDRANTQNLMQMQIGQQVELQKRLAPVKTQQALEEEAGKMELRKKMGFGGVPQGVTVTGGTYNPFTGQTTQTFVTPEGLKQKTPVQIQQQLVETQDNMRNVNDLVKLAGPIKKISGSFLRQRGEALFSNLTGGRTNEDLRLYMDTAQASAAGIYRSLTGDKRLSDRDAQQRAIPLLWRPDKGESYELGQRKFRRLQQAFRRRAQLLASGQFSTDEMGNAITPLSNLGLDEMDEIPPEFEVIE